MIAQPLVGDQNDPGAAVGHLAAVEAAQPALDDGVVAVVVGRADPALTKSRVCALGLLRAFAKLSAAIARRCVSSMPYRRSYSRGHPVEHVRPHELGVGALVVGPRGGAQVLGGGVTGHRLLQFDADDERRSVGAGSQVRDGRQGGDAARGARGLVPGGGCVP